MSSYFDDLNDEIQKGREGNNEGLNNGFDRLNNYLCGVQKEIYTVAGPTGCGKSNFVLDAFVYKPIIFNTKKRFKILYFSLELSRSVILTKIAGHRMFDKFQDVVTYKDLLSRGKDNRLKDNLYERWKSDRKFYDHITDRIIINDNRLSPESLYRTLKTYAEANGRFEEKEYGRLDYIPKDPDLQTIIIIDHIGLVSHKGALKNAIDDISKYLVWFRNHCGYTSVIVQQVNRDHTSGVRRQTGYHDQLQLSDLKDSGGTSEASEVVLALFSPNRERLNNHLGYDIGRLGDRYRCLQILKNRFGESDKALGLSFHGEIGRFSELPRELREVDYNQILNWNERNE